MPLGDQQQCVRIASRVEHTVFLTGGPTTGGFASMIGDVTDESELATGQRQEGLFAAVIAFTLKATAGLGMLLAGLALDWIAFPRQQAAENVGDEKLAALGIAVGPGIMLLFALSVVFLARYRLSRGRHQAVLAALAGRAPTG